MDPPPHRHRIGEIATSFLKLGLIAFGGPAAHVAIFEDEFVRRRKWISRHHFLDLIGATNLIPGPNSTELAIHIGFVRAGWPGFFLAGLCFIAPAMLIILGFSWFYVRYGEIPEIEAILYGIKPVMIAIILQAFLSLGKVALKSWLHVAFGFAALVVYFLGMHPLTILVIFGALFFTIYVLKERFGQVHGIFCLSASIVPGILINSVPFSYTTLFFTFLKIGAVLYGSGYVLLAYLQADFVEQLGWVTEQQLLDAISIGQVTPGPLFTAATFIGYLVGGLPGGLLATLGIFLPSFIFVAISNPVIPRMRSSHSLSILLDGINVLSLGMMAAITVVLGRAALVDPVSIGIFLVAAGLLFFFKVNATWLILGGAIIGWLASFIR